MNPSHDPGRAQQSPEKAHIWDNPRNVHRLLRIFYAVCVALVLMDFVVHRHIAHPWEGFFGFHAFYGFVACWVLVVVAKLMRRVLMRDEDYYDVD
jgi:hypothetical protein